jgi:hypothetical protein
LVCLTGALSQFAARQRSALAAATADLHEEECEASRAPLLELSYRMPPRATAAPRWRAAVPPDCIGLLAVAQARTYS